MLAKNESHTTRTVSRSGSLLGTIKSILPSKFFSWNGESPDTPGKRKGVDESHEAEEGQRSSKRQRVGGSSVGEITQSQVLQRQQQQLVPPPRSAFGYLEPPDKFFGSVNTAATSRQGNHACATSLVPSARPPQASGSTRELSTGTSASTRGRTMSTDPPNRYRSSYGTTPKPLSRDVSMEDGWSEKSMSASPSRRFRMRTSLTPQPSGNAFGPEPARRERDGSEPPPLAQLIDKPMFVKAPSEAPQTKASTSTAPTTLGALARTQRTDKGAQRSHSSLNIGSDSSMQDVAAVPAPEPARPINTTERILRELDVYKTPLVPMRLRDANGLPDMFKHKKGHGFQLMHDRDSRIRLGAGEKSEDVDDAQGSKPYAGRGGMKKLLARRRQEEEKEKEKERAAIFETDEEEALRTSQKAKELDEKLLKDLDTPLEPEPEPERPSVAGRPQSSLRVGRTKSARKTIDRPKARGRGGGRFSAFYDEEEEDFMDDGIKQQSPKKAPAWTPPLGFSFARDTTPLMFDTTGAKEAPLPSLPFSLSPTPPVRFSDANKNSDKPATIALPKGFSKDSDVPHPSPPITVAAESQAVFAPAPLTPLLSAVPQIALIPPTPGSAVLASAPNQPAAEQLGASVTGKGSSAVPNFFTSSAALTKPSAQVSLPSNFSFGAPPSSSSAVPTTNATKQPSLFGMSGEEEGSGPKPHVNTRASDNKHPVEASKVPQQPLFSGFSTNPTSVFTRTPETAPVKRPDAVAEPAKDTPLITAPTPTSAFTFPKPTEKTDKSTLSGFTFGAPKPVEGPATTPSPLSFAFGAQTTKSAETTAAGSKSPPNDAASKPGFTFGAPSTGAAQPSPFGTPSPSAEPLKSPFIFGGSAAQPSASAATPSAPAPAAQATKPLFGGASGFTFGQPSATSVPEPAKSSFAFGTPAPSTPAAEKQPFVFGGSSSTGTPAPAGSTLFGTPAPNGSAAPKTPPRKEEGDSSMMDESPVRGGGMDLNGNKTESMALNGSGFNLTPASISSPFGQPAQTSSSQFAFGSGAGAANPFAAKTDAAKSAESKPAAGFLFGQRSTSTSTSTSTGFFGQKAADNGSMPTATGGFPFVKPTEAAAPAGFAFGQKPIETNAAPPTNGFAFGTPTTPTISTPSFFGAPQIAPSTSFGQTASATSTTPSPNPFSQPAQPNGGGFNFNAPTPTSATAPSKPFAFGSQPASPATTPAGLPGQNGTTGFNFGAGTVPASTPSPFAPPAALPATGAVFTMGAIPPPAPGGGVVGRQIKKLPNRRGGKR